MCWSCSSWCTCSVGSLHHGNCSLDTLGADVQAGVDLEEVRALQARNAKSRQPEPVSLQLEGRVPISEVGCRSASPASLLLLWQSWHLEFPVYRAEPACS